MGLWNSSTGVPIVTLEGHSHSVTSLSFSLGGSQLASGSYDNTVRLWGGSTSVPIATLVGHSKFVTSLSFSPDGSWLASASHDETVILWNSSLGIPIATLEGHLKLVTSFSLSSDGSQLASGSDDNTVKLWDCITGIQISFLEGHSRSVTSLSFSLDGSRLASGSVDNMVRAWDCATGASIAVLEGRPQSVYSLLRSPLAPRPSACFGVDRHKSQTSRRGYRRLFLHFEYQSWPLFIEQNATHVPMWIKDPSRRYYIQGTVPSSNCHVPLLWLPVDTPAISEGAFCSKAAAFGCDYGRVIILGLTQLILQVT